MTQPGQPGGIEPTSLPTRDVEITKDTSTSERRVRVEAAGFVIEQGADGVWMVTDSLEMWGVDSIEEMRDIHGIELPVHTLNDWGYQQTGTAIEAVVVALIARCGARSEVP